MTGSNYIVHATQANGEPFNSVPFASLHDANVFANAGVDAGTFISYFITWTNSDGSGGRQDQV